MPGQRKKPHDVFTADELIDIYAIWKVLHAAPGTPDDRDAAIPSAPIEPATTAEFFARLDRLRWAACGDADFRMGQFWRDTTAYFNEWMIRDWGAWPLADPPETEDDRP